MKTHLLFVLLIPACLFSQLETSQWHFNNYAALDFMSGSPVFVNTSAMFANKYCGASCADSAGNLLFYTNGVTIFNKNHSVMQNGSIGPNSRLWASQAALVFPMKNKIFKIVLPDYHGSGSVPLPRFINQVSVDMSANNGLGAVISTVQPFSPQNVRMVAKIAGTKHCNGIDYWLLAHETTTTSAAGSQNFHAYRVSPDSIFTTPVISSIGSLQFDHNGEFGILKFSPNGRKIAATFPNRTVELFDFDNATGQVSNALQLEAIISPSVIPFSESNAYGLEFSPDGNRLYVTYLKDRPAVCQYDLAAGSPSAIIASKTIINPDTVGLPPNQTIIALAIQLAHNGKIYVAEPDLNTLGVINNPNALGTLCNYSPATVSLGINITTNPSVPALCGMGLPNFISNYFEQKPSIPPLTGTITCGAASFSMPVLNAFAGYSVTSQAWNFGDPLSGAANTSSVNNPNHVFSANGTYTVKLILNYKCGADTLTKLITVSGLPELIVTAKPKICVGESAALNFSGAATYSLNGIAVNQNSAMVQPSVTSVYTISGSDNNCQSSKVFNVTVMPCTVMRDLSSEQLEVTVYPNPSHGVFIVAVNQSTQISITDLSGRLTYTAQLRNGAHSIDLSKYANGFYLLKAENENGSQVIKLVKE